MDHCGVGRGSRSPGPLPLPAGWCENTHVFQHGRRTDTDRVWLKEERRAHICSRPAASSAHQYFSFNSIFRVRLLPKA